MNKGTLVLVFLLLAAMVQCSVAQTIQNTNAATSSTSKSITPLCHQLPFASSGNTIELTVANTATIPLNDVKVEAKDVPTWLTFNATTQHIAALKASQELPVTFTFAVDKMAPVQKSQTLKFVVTEPTGESWTKEITIAVAAPEKFEAFQNYPNPFNPTTKISYQLTAVSRVSLRIYNMLGQEVTSLVDEDRPAGYHQEVWDATRCASGVYVYQLIATNNSGAKQIAHKRMLLLK